MKGYHVATATVALALLGVFCLQPPTLPEWDTTLNLPLYRGTFRLVDFLDSARFHIRPDSTIEFACEFPIDTVSPDGVIDVLSVDDASRIELSDFVFTGLSAAATGMGIEDLVGFPIPDTGVKIAVPPFELTLPSQAELPGVMNAEVLDGVLRAVVVNRTALPLDSVVLQFPFGQVRFDAVSPGATCSRRVSIGGTCVSSPVDLMVTLGSPGIGSDTTVLTKSDSLLVQVEVDSLSTSSARIRIPTATGSRQCRVALGSSQPFRIDSLALATGRCQVQLINDFSVRLDAVVRVPKLNRSYSRSIPGKGQAVIDLDLGGVRIDNRSKMNCLIEFDVAATPQPSEEYVDLGKRDGLVVNYETHDLEPRRIAGEFRRPVYVTSMLESLPQILPVGLTGLRVPNAEMTLDITSGIRFPLQVFLDLVAHRDGSELCRTRQVLSIPPGRDDQPSHSQWMLPVTELINAGPDLITFEYTTMMCGRGEHVTGTWLAGRAALCTPLRMAFVPDTIAGPAYLLALDQSHRDLIAEHFVSSEVRLSITNHFPAGFGGWLRLMPDSTAAPARGVLFDSLTFPVRMPAGRLDERGNCIGATDTTVVVTLDSAQASLLRRSPLNARLFIDLPATDTFSFRATDRLEVEALLELNVRVKP